MEEQHLRRALQPGPECPSIERLGRYADGTLSIDERRGAESHVAACANCQAELVLLQTFTTPAVREDEAEAVRWGVDQLARREHEIFSRGQPHESSARRWLSFGGLRPGLALAAVLLTVAGGYFLINPAVPRLPADIGSTPDAARSLSVALQGPIGDQTAVPVRLQWTAVDGAARYHVRMSEVDRQEIWSGDTANTAVDLPADVRARVAPGKTLVWQVTAYGTSNAPIAESNAERFRLVR